MPDWLDEFSPDYEVPGIIPFLIRKKIIEDLSWHNDVAPSFGVTSEPLEKTIQLWVDHPFKSRREHGDSKRFFVTVYIQGSQEESFEFDELDDALEKLFNLIAEIKLGRMPGVLEWRPPDTLSESEWEDPKGYLYDLKHEYIDDPRA